jgi:DNA-binding beta-propeller fold protein YncE
MPKAKRTNPPWLCLPIVAVSVWLLSQAPVWSMGMGGIDFGGGATEPVLTEQLLSIEKGPLPSPLRIDLNVKPNRRNKGLLVSDHYTQAIYKVDQNDPDQVSKLFDVNGYPMALASYGKYVFVGNRSEGQVQLYNYRGRLLKAYKTKEKMFPRDFAIDQRSRKLLVVDGYAKNVKVFNFSGRLTSTIDGFGELYEPQAVAVDPSSRKVVITDFGDPGREIDPSLQVFSASGESLLKIDGHGQFSSPRGVAVGDGKIFMVDHLRGQVLVFDLESGTMLGAAGSFGTGAGQLFTPADVVYQQATKTLYVTSQRMGRVVALDVQTY